MRLRIAKKIGKTYPERHRLTSKRRAFNRIWKQDVRKHGLPTNYDCFMAIIWEYPSLGGRLKTES